ncbi:hypothetical protein [Pseudoalteromonas rubra]|nr:hypothetical protein [Pseudoalteromonas rubra]
MNKTTKFTPKTIDALELKKAVTGAGFDIGIHPVFIGYQEPIEDIKF